MSIELKVVALLVALGLILGGVLSVFEYGKYVEGLERDKVAAEEYRKTQKEISDSFAANDKLKTQLGVQHAQDTAVTERVRADFAAYRLRLPQAQNCNGDGVPNATGGSMGGSAGGGSDPDPTQAALDRFTDGLKSDSHAVDSVLDRCRVVMSWARNICQLDKSCKGLADASGK